MKKLKLFITPNDIVQAERFGLPPVLFALQHWTGTLWRFYDGGYLQEAMQPFRACQLSPAALQKIDDYQKNGGFGSLLLDLELHPTQEVGGYSLIQQRQCALKPQGKMLTS